jgi:hypothetical protein
MEDIAEVNNPLMLKMKDITLEFLTNPLYHNMLHSKSGLINNRKINKQDIKFYRKRIYALSKDLLKGDSPNESLKKIHDDYVNAAINYLKMIDTKDIIQEQYQNQNEIVPDINTINFSNEMGSNEMGSNVMGSNEMGSNVMGSNEMGSNVMGSNEMGPNEMGPNESTNVADANQQMMRKIVNISNLDNYVVVTHANNTGNEYTMPTKKEINLHTQELKTKGIIKKDKKGKKPKE